MNSLKPPLPAGFRYADDCGFPCLTDAKYAGADNFMGRPAKGYNAPLVVVSAAVGEAISLAAPLFLRRGLLMKLFDAYRPQRAVDDFAAWAENLSDTARKKIHYPNIEKADLFRLDYIARRSGHTRGCAVDLTLADAHTGEALDMGTVFDFMDERSWHGASGLSHAQRQNRALLAETMLACGFCQNPMEWWHFALKKEPFPDRYFDFEIGEP